MDDENAFAVITIEDAARRFDNLAVAAIAQFAWHRAALGILRELADMIEYSLYQRACSGGIFEGDVVGDSV